MKDRVYKDITLVCIDCEKPFVFTAGEQEFYVKKHLVMPKRCKACRANRHYDPKLIGLGSVTGKMGLQPNSYMKHTAVYGPSVNVNGGLPNSPGFRYEKTKNGAMVYKARVGKKTVEMKHTIK